MYVARHLSEHKKNPNALSLPPEGPNSGFLVIQDEEAETYCCFGMCKNPTLQDLPFPQNKALTIRYTQSSGVLTTATLDETIFIPVLNLPLSSNRYYAIKPRGSHKGEAVTCAMDGDTGSCCFCSYVKDIKPQPFDPRNVYQQFEVSVHEGVCVPKGYFYAKSVAPDGHPPYYMRRKGWTMDLRSHKNYELEEALGLNASLRANRPKLDFLPSHDESEAVVVGRWYAPFIFVKERVVSEQVKNSTYYEVTLVQKWDQIFFSHNVYHENKSVSFDVNLDQEMVHVSGNMAEWDEKDVVENAIWYKGLDQGGEEVKVGLGVEIVERMKWEQGRGGWNGGRERQVSVKRTEKFGGNGIWKDFGCYVLVESFVFKRMDASVALKYDFRHNQHIKTMWE